MDTNPPTDKRTTMTDSAYYDDLVRERFRLSVKVQKVKLEHGFDSAQFEKAWNDYKAACSAVECTPYYRKKLSKRIGG